MRHWLLGLGILAFTGCATSTKLEREARRHDMRADAAANVRDYDRAAAEKAEAERLHRKAVKKTVNEGTTEGVVIPTTPAEVPHEAPPVLEP